MWNVEIWPLVPQESKLLALSNFVVRVWDGASCLDLGSCLNPLGTILLSLKIWILAPACPLKLHDLEYRLVLSGPYTLPCVGCGVPGSLEYRGGNTSGLRMMARTQDVLSRDLLELSLVLPLPLACGGA